MVSSFFIALLKLKDRWKISDTKQLEGVLGGCFAA